MTILPRMIRKASLRIWGYGTLFTDLNHAKTKDKSMQIRKNRKYKFCEFLKFTFRQQKRSVTGADDLLRRVLRDEVQGVESGQIIWSRYGSKCKSAHSTPIPTLYNEASENTLYTLLQLGCHIWSKFYLVGMSQKWATWSGNTHCIFRQVEKQEVLVFLWQLLHT